MALPSTLTARLAFQVDKQILQAEEEDYLRLDLSAHEVTGRSFFRPKKSFKLAFPSLPQNTILRFAISALAIYLLLFGVTNAPAYTKIIKANLVAMQAERNLEETLTVLSQGIAPTEQAALLTVLASEESRKGFLSLDITPTTYDNRLVLPSLNINAPIVEPELGLDAVQAKDWNALEDQIRSTLLQGVVHFPGTANPGKIGNAFLTGHSSNVLWEPSPYNTVFALLPAIEVGADIYVTYKQKEYHYVVTDKKEVSPLDVSILKQGDDKILTLMTCTPVGTTLKRLVVTAALVD